ncbi:MAG: hypothetical protein FJ117_02465 [Deltaproteobacteria bacterium]|nr:hypothetical protein [Deltaproteobacteria bacterium]
MATDTLINCGGKLAELSELNKAIGGQISRWGEEFQVTGINDLANLEDLAYLLKYASVHGWYPKKVSSEKIALQP